MNTDSRATEKVLRSLFWKLFFRGRAKQQAQGGKVAMRKASAVMTLVMYAIFGAMPCFAVQRLDVMAFSATLHAMTLIMVLVNMAASAGTFLFNHEEAEILLHRPVEPAMLLRAKVWVLVMVALVLGLAFNLAGTIGGCFTNGGNWLFAPAHLVSLSLETMFATALLVLIYNLCLRWFGRERLDNLMATAQTIMTVGLVLGSQLMPRLISAGSTSVFSGNSPWLWVMPTSWFAAFDVAVCKGGDPLLWMPAALAVIMTALVSWLALSKLAGSYGEGLVALNEASPSASASKPRRRWLGWLCQRAPLKWWLRDPVERHAFLLTTAYMTRDREMKMRLYPGLAPMGAYMLLMLFTGGARRPDDSGWQVAFASAYIGFLPMIAMDLLRLSEHWRACDVFRIAPLAHWKPLFHGARKAVMACIILPGVLVVIGLGLWMSRDVAKLVLLVPNMLLLPLWCLVPGVMGMWLPLSRPFDQQTQSSRGCLKMAVVIGSSMAVAGLGCWAYQAGWLGRMVIIELVVVALIMTALRFVIARSPWTED